MPGFSLPMNPLGYKLGGRRQTRSWRQPEARPMSQLPKTCIIGAGTSGVICSKVLKQHGIPFDTFEAGSGLGGIWRFQNDNGMSTCYRSLHINTSKRMMELSDFKFRPEIAEFPTHNEILSEFERYADQFQVKPHIQFQTRVTHCERQDGGGWQISLEGPGGARTEHYDFLIVANGHHWSPRLATYPGHFDGLHFHSHHYVDTTTPHDLRGKRVVVVGMGNSAMDIACELGRIGQGAEKVFLAQRSGVWVIPKVLGNIPQDKLVRHPMQKPGLIERLLRTLVPRRLRLAAWDMTMEAVIKILAGSPQRVGLKAPREHFHSRHPTVSQELFNRLVHGDITPKGNIKELRGDRVLFEDGTEEQVDVIISATGYNIEFPFFDKTFIDAPGNSIPLWQRIFDPELKDLAFLGLVQPVCAMMPIAELQSNFIADYLVGEVALPVPADMERQMKAFDETMKADYTLSESHTIQIDCPEYSYLLQKEWKKARKRARAAGNPIPVPAGT